MILDRLNTQYGSDLGDADLLFRSTLDSVASREDVQLAATNSTRENFDLVFPEYFRQELLGQVDRHEKAVFRYLDDENLRAKLHRIFGTLPQARARVAYQQHCPIGELLAAGEGAHLEYKSSLRTAPRPARSSSRNGTREIASPDERQRYVASRWGTSATARAAS